MSTGSDTEIADRIRVAFNGYVENQKGLSPADRKAALEQADSIVTGLANPWMRSFLALDHRPFLEKVKVPTLALNGGLDLQVPAGENLSAIKKAFEAGGNSSLLTTIRLEGLNHLFQHAKSGLPSEYATIDETFTSEALKAIAGWIVADYGKR